MGLSDYNLSGEKKRDLSYFASVVKLALTDDLVTEGEEKLLKSLAKRFHILEDKYTEILENPDKYSVHTPRDYDERIEQLFELTKMVYADDEVTGDEAGLLRRICVGLGFPLDNVVKVADEAIFLILNDDCLEEFTKAIKYVNRI